MAKSDEVTIAAVAETSAGSTPTTPAWDVMRLLSDSIDEEADTEPSAELSNDRGTINRIEKGRQTTGSIESYLFANTVQEEFLSGVLGNDWSADVLVPAFDVKTWTLEKSYPIGLSAAPRYLRTLGLGFGSFSINAPPQEAVALTFEAVGGFQQDDAVEVAGSTYTAASPAKNLAPPMRSAEMAFSWSGEYSQIDPASICHTGMTLDVNANAEVRRCLTVASASEFEPGPLSGTLEVTFLLHRFVHGLFAGWRTGNEGACTITFADQTASPNNHTIAFALNRLVLTQLSVPTPSKGQDVVANATFQILQPDGGDAITITRATA